jgi:phosphate/sulfate permease
LALQPVDTGKDSLIGGLKGLAMKYAKEQALGALAKSAPWLFGKAIGWLANPILGFFLDMILGYFLDQTILGLSLVYIAVDVQYDVKSAEEVAAKLKHMLENPVAYTEKQMKDAEENFDDESVDLIRIGMSNVP